MADHHARGAGSEQQEGDRCNGVQYVRSSVMNVSLAGVTPGMTGFQSALRRVYRSPVYTIRAARHSLRGRLFGESDGRSMR